MNALQKQELAVVAQPDSSSLMRIIDRAATDPAFDVAKLEQLLAVKERWEANESRKAFVVALGAFKANPPEILKNKHVEFTGSKGTTAYDHATLDNVSSSIGTALSAHGLSHRWDVEQLEAAIKVTCVLTHVLGHSERVSMTAGRDDSGSKNNIQALGSTVTYLQRYTLLAATGMAVKGQDNDGGGGDEGLPEGAVADYCASIEAADSMEALQKAYSKAAAAALKEADKPSMRSFIEAKEQRQKALRA